MKMVFHRKFSFRRQSSSGHAREELGTSKGALDCTLHIFSLFIFLVSCGVLGLSLWLLLKDFNLNQISDILGDNLLLIVVFTAVGAASVALVASLIFCCGIKQNGKGLGIYAFVLILLVVAFAVVAIFASIFREKLNGVDLKLNTKERLLLNYGVQNDSQKAFSRHWDIMQQTFSCCGAFGNINDTTSWAVYRESEWFHNLPAQDFVYVPQSCCIPNRNTHICQKGDPKLFGPPLYGPPMRQHFNQINPHINTDGCYEKISKYLTQVTFFITIVAGCIAGLLVIMVILTFLFCAKVKKEEEEEEEEYEYADFNHGKHTKGKSKGAAPNDEEMVTLNT